MINFFRKTRKKLADDNKLFKYSRYAIGEIVLVVIGILIALSINNWKEERKVKADEIKVLINIKRALQSDLDNAFVTYLEMARTYHKKTTSIVTHMKSNLDFKDSLGQDFLVLSTGGYLKWTPQLTAYKRLESRGVDIIKKDSLLEAILDIYNLDYPSIQSTFDNYLRNIHDYGRPLARKKFKLRKLRAMDAELIPIDSNLLFEDVELSNTILTLQYNSSEIEKYMLTAKANVEHVIKMIDEELQHRN